MSGGRRIISERRVRVQRRTVLPEMYEFERLTERKEIPISITLFEIRKIAVCFLWLSLPGDYRVTDEALLAETT